MMPLSLATVGEPNTIKKIGGSPEVKKHLENLGFVVGGGVTVGDKAVIPPHAMIREDVKGGEQA